MKEENNKETTPKKRGRTPKKTQYYVNPAEFKEELQKCYDDGIISNKLGKMLLDIVTGLSYRPNFMNYTYREEMVGDAIQKMVKAVRDKNFDFNKGSNPFSYFNRIAWRAFLVRIQDEKKKRSALDLYQEEVYAEVLSEFGCYISPEHHDEESE